MNFFLFFTLTGFTNVSLVKRTVFTEAAFYHHLKGRTKRYMFSELLWNKYK